MKENQIQWIVVNNLLKNCKESDFAFLQRLECFIGIPLMLQIGKRT
jgi:hypothetical protein